MFNILYCFRQETSMIMSAITLFDRYIVNDWLDIISLLSFIYILNYQTLLIMILLYFQKL